MPTTDLLKTFGLSRNPFTDRTAEKTSHDDISLYVHSDLRGFRPNDTTYIFFGKRGAGKTTIRLQMQEAYTRDREQAVTQGRRGHFVVDLSTPGHLTACLTTYQERVAAGPDSWDAVFSETWTSADMVDCILSYAATALMATIARGGKDAGAMLDVLRANPQAGQQFLLLAHLYARTDTLTLFALRCALLRQSPSVQQVTVGALCVASCVGAAVAAARSPDVADALTAPFEGAWDAATQSVPSIHRRPRLVAAATAGLVAAGAYGLWGYRHQQGMQRAAALQAAVRVVKPQPLRIMAALVDRLFSPYDTVDTIQQLTIGQSAHQKLDLLQRLVQVLGYDSLAVFGDCFDEVTLLDPVRFPGAIRAFAREVCRNDLLSFGRLHIFFPDSRLALDLNTDRTLKEARFDRHFVRDLTWSRHQLEELAERRFRAAQDALRREAQLSGRGGGGAAELEAAARQDMSFVDLFKQVRGEDFSSYLSKLSTPRELMIMMTEMFARIEAHPEGGLTAQDMEIAVEKALTQSV